MTNNKSKIEKLLREKSRTAEELGEQLTLPRNYVSAILNDLVREGRAKKKKGRPVLFSIHPDYLTEDLSQRETSPVDRYDPFEALIGYKGSLINQIQLCKQSVKYPNGCLPIMLLGDSGVGKSFMAKIIHSYAVQEKIISENAPFLTFNCADYANNPELISSILFGYKKGAFTGADQDKKGLFELADGGFLFLDEIHRLTSEGQEKLFRYLDKNSISPLGSDQELSLDTNLIFATTENTDIFLDTFTRRIPIIIDVPSYIKRSADERRQLIMTFFLQESEIFNKDIEVSGTIFDALVSFDSKGNIGRIKNIIKILCTSANNENDKLVINLNNAIGIKDLSLTIRSTEVVPTIKIDRNWKDRKLSNVERSIDEFFTNLENDITFDEGARKDRFAKGIGKLFERMHFEASDNYMENLITPNIKVILEYISTKYGLQNDSIMENFLSKLLTQIPISFPLVPDSKENIANLKVFFKNDYPKEYSIAKIIINFLENNSFIRNSNREVVTIVITVLIISRLNINHELCNALIISHGTSTATSISSVVNSLFGQYIYEAFDMPLDSSKEEIVKKIEGYLTHVDVHKDLLIFVDMGSLLNIGEDLQKVVRGNMVVINNTTTQTAIHAANEIVKKTSVLKIAEEIVKTSKTTYFYTKGSERKNVILVSCLSGAGTSTKIKELLEECAYDINVSFQELDYLNAGDLDRLEDLYPNYNILGIISTIPIIGEKYPVIMLSELVKSTGLTKLGKLLRTITEDEKLDAMINLVIEKFTSQNLLQRLTFLNPTSVIPDVQQCLREIELSLKITIPFESKYLLYIHISILIERLIKNDEYQETNDLKAYYQENHVELTLIKYSFIKVEKKYNVSVNQYELMLIHRMLTDTREENS